MSRLTQRLSIALFTLLAAASAHAAADRYAMQWPIVPSEAGEGAYRVQLTPDVYRAVMRPDMRDVDVVDAGGRSVPASVIPPRSALAVRTVTLPWFVVPASAAGAETDWTVIAEVDAQGRLRGVRSSASGDGREVASALLLDAGAVQGRIGALLLDWTPAAPLDRGYTVEGSNDLEHWLPLARGRLVDVRQDGRRLLQRRIDLDPATATPRYLRVVPDGSSTLPAITSVAARVEQPLAERPHWLRLPPVAQSGSTYDFTMPGRFPVSRVDIDTAGADARRWRLQSRDDADAPWRSHAEQWVVYRLGAPAARSDALVLDRPVRDRYWRLVAQGTGGAPALRLGYVPEDLVFVAAGAPPHALRAGSASAVRSDAAVAETLQAMRAKHGDAWRPAAASLGSGQVLAGDEAYAARRDWTTWALWAALGIGALVVAGFALRLLREPVPSAD